MKAKTIAKRILGFIVVAMIFLAECKAANFLLVDDAAEYPRNTFYEFYNQKDIDILLVGASHSYMSLIPAVITEKTGKASFNASSARQAPDATYTVIKEADSMYDLEHIYMEMSHTVADITGNYKERTSQMKYVYLVSDYLKPSLNKLRYLLNASAGDQYMNSFFRARRKTDSVLNWKYMAKIYQKKRDKAYRNYEYKYVTRKSRWYGGQGYIANIELFAEDGYYMTKVGFNPFDTDKISDDWDNSLLDIIDYCKKHDIPLTLYSSPVSNFLLLAEGNYDVYIDYVNDLIEGTGIQYVDMNLVKAEYFQYERGTYMDTDHFNIAGAERFTDFFIDYMNGKIPDDAFCDSVYERMDMEDPAFYGIVYSVETEEIDEVETTTNYAMRLVANHPEAFEFKIEIVPDQPEEEEPKVESDVMDIRRLEEVDAVQNAPAVPPVEPPPVNYDPILVQDFGHNMEFTVDPTIKGKIVVTYRYVDHPQEEIVVEKRIP